MKKIPTLFKRIYKDHKVIGITQEVTEGCEPVLRGIATPTVKYDGSCCAIISGNLYKRYDVKKGKKPPEGAIPCQESPDPVTGHLFSFVGYNTFRYRKLAFAYALKVLMYTSGWCTVDKEEFKDEKWIIVRRWRYD